MRVTFCFFLAVLIPSVYAAEPKIGVVDDGLPGQDPKLTAALIEALRPVFANPKRIAPEVLNDLSQLKALDLLVIPSARSIPPKFVPTLAEYLSGGGKVVACGMPLGGMRVFRAGDRWIARDEYDRLASQTKPQRILLRFDASDVKRLNRSTNNKQSGLIESTQSGDGETALHVTMPELLGWDTVNTVIDHPFASGHTLTCFRAKGSNNTRQLAVEWEEKDGSRWIATVNLTHNWQNYALPPSAFVPWQPPSGRGKPGDALNVINAHRFAVGLAFTHTEFERGPHEYWFTNLGTAEAPFGVSPEATLLPHVDGLCPEYQFFPLHGAATLRTLPDQRNVTEAEIPPPENLIALHPRPGGTGFEKHRKRRWQPLLEAYTAQDDDRGTVAALSISLQQHPSAIAVFTPTESAFYRQPGVQRILADVARALRRGAFLAEGGSRYFTQLKSQPLQLGTNVVTLAPRENLAVRIMVVDANKKAEVWRFNASEPIAKSFDASQMTWPLWVVTELLDGGDVIDRIQHQLDEYDVPDRPRFIEARDGGFFLDGKPWKAHGVNYMPSSGIGLGPADQDQFEHWLGASSYDPQIVQRDLERIRKMNMNAVSAFIYHRSLADGNLLDFLRRCEALGLKVNLSLRPGTPMEFEWEKIRQIIETSKLAQNNTVFAYDLAWEPSHFDHRYQQAHYGKRWASWIIKKYGRIGAAFRSWNASPIILDHAPPSDGEIQVPDEKTLTSDGPTRQLAIDYRQFLNELLAENYGKARDLVKSIDPNHLVSFRMTITGDPTANDPNNLAYDFYGLKDAVDIWAPEAYGRIGDWTRVRDGRFTTAYARLCDPNKPLMWAEAGVSVWDRAGMRPSENRLVFQAQYARDFYRLLRENGDDGIFWWWFPGGYRTNEQSDFGIINPDGSDRPVTKVIREEGVTFLAAEKPGKPDLFLPISRDKDARGIFGIYETTNDAFWKAIDEGKRPGLAWKIQQQSN